MSEKRFSAKTIWITIGIVIFVALMIFVQYYDIVLIKKVNTGSDSNNTGQVANIDSSADSAGPTVNMDEITIDVDNLTAEELAAVNAFLKFKKIRAAFVPMGVPEVYGAGLSISFDEVQDAINKVQIFGPTYGKQKITLTGNNMERYKAIGASISCEYCCGVKTLTREDGTAACGCAHSVMMRGLAAYLITNYPEVSDEWILGELSKWKITYFPKQTLSAELKKLEDAGEEGIRELLQEFPDFLPQMVGGC